MLNDDNRRYTLWPACQVGPTIVDFALAGDLQEYLADGQLTLEITNADIVAVTDHSEG